MTENGATPNEGFDGFSEAALAERGTIKKLLYVLSPREKRQLVILTPAVIVMALLDTVGIASIVPFLGLLSDPNAIKGSHVLTWAYAAGGFNTQESFFFAVGFAVLAVLTFGNAFGAITTWALLHFSWMRNHSLSIRLLDAYLQRPYAYFLTQNTSQLAQKILAEVQQVVTGVIVQSMNLAARALVIVFILGALVLLDPAMALGVGVVFGGLYGALYWAVRRQLDRLGRNRVFANRQRFKLASEMLTGIKEVKLAGLERTFLRRYGDPSARFASSLSRAQVLSQLPRFALETVAFGGVLLMVLYLLQSGRPLNDILPVIGLYAFASYRMLPGLQVVFAGISSVRNNLAALDALVVDLPPVTESKVPLSRPPPLPFARALALHDVEFSYANVDRPTLHGVSLELAHGEWVALVGPTGSGKSTLVDILLGLLRPSRGVMKVDEIDITDDNLAAWQRNAGYVPQQIFLADDTIARNIAFGDDEDVIDMDRLRHAAQVAQIHEFIERELPNGYDTDIGERGIRLSGGQRQRVGIARAVYREPKFLVLDEATSALDNDTESRFFEALKGALRGVSVVSIAHRLTTTRGFDRIYVVESGKIVDAGNFNELVDRSPHFRPSEIQAGSPPVPGGT